MNTCQGPRDPGTLGGPRCPKPATVMTPFGPRCDECADALEAAASSDKTLLGLLLKTKRSARMFRKPIV